MHDTVDRQVALSDPILTKTSGISIVDLRPAGAKVPLHADTIRELEEMVETFDALLARRGYHGMDDEQRAALWCADPEDTFGMFDDWTARFGLDSDAVLEAANSLFELLPAESQQNLRELDMWGAL